MQNLFQKFTSHLKEALLKAYHIAQKEQRMTIAPRHLFISLASQHGSLAAEVLHKRGLREEIYLDPNLVLTDIDPANLELSDEAKNIVQKMVAIAFDYQHNYVGTEHLLAALVNNPTEGIIDYLVQKNINQRELAKEVENLLTSNSNFSDITDIFTENLPFNLSDNMMAMPGRRSSDKSILETFTRDLTSEEAQKDLDPVIGREEEIARLINILSRRTKNNPLLLGEPGVGKTAIVEGLAKRIYTGDVPAILANKKILMLDLSLLVAGTMYRGEFESRLKQLMDELKKSPNSIIFIDELHAIVGAGSSTGGSLDAANILKPALARGDLRCIGATTLNEFRKSIESDPALNRRFQPIIVREQSASEVAIVLKGIKKYYENFHHVKIFDETIKTAIRLSERYINDRYLPDKAIDLLDEAAARVRVANTHSPDNVQVLDLDKNIEKLEKEKELLVAEEKFDEAWAVKNKQKDLQAQKQSLLAGTSKIKQINLTPDMIADVVANMTGIPRSYILASGDFEFGDLDKVIKKQIIGQDKAIDRVVKTLQRAQISMTKPNRPLGTFMFMGPTGVGKTALAKVLASHVFKSRDALIRVDMSEFSEKFTISKLIGSPAGYVGYKESGMLTERVRRQPYSVVLFDEIEKAHPDIFNVLLNILDEGYITDATGIKIDFTNAIIIMTSNIGANKFNINTKFGFADPKKSFDSDLFDQVTTQVTKDLENYFRPEFINRLDATIVFNPLGANELVKIVDMELADLRQRLQQHNLKLSVSDLVKRQIVQDSYAPQKGAREIARQVEERIEHPLIEEIINKRFCSGDSIKVGMVKDNITLSKLNNKVKA